MFKYKAIIFLKIVFFFIAVGDCVFFISEKKTTQLIKALHATETGWENEKTTTLEKLADAIRMENTNITIAASQRVYDRNGKLEKNVRIFCKIPSLTMVSIDQEKQHDLYEESQKHMKEVMDAARELPGLYLSAYAKIIDEDGEVQEGLMNKNFTYYYYDSPDSHKIPKYNFTIVTTKEGMDKISKIFKNAPEPTILKLDVDGKILDKESIWTPFNTIVFLGEHSTKIPPSKIIEDAMVAYGKYMLPYPMRPWVKADKDVFKQIALDLRSKHSDYSFVLLGDKYFEVAISCDNFIRLKYNIENEIKICIYKKDKLGNFVSRFG